MPGCLSDSAAAEKRRGVNGRCGARILVTERAEGRCQAVPQAGTRPPPQLRRRLVDGHRAAPQLARARWLVADLRLPFHGRRELLGQLAYPSFDAGADVEGS